MVRGVSQNSLINYVMEKCLDLLLVWGDWNVGMFVSILFLMRREADKVETCNTKTRAIVLKNKKILAKV